VIEVKAENWPTINQRVWSCSQSSTVFILKPCSSAITYFFTLWTSKQHFLPFSSCTGFGSKGGGRKESIKDLHTKQKRQGKKQAKTYTLLFSFMQKKKWIFKFARIKTPMSLPSIKASNINGAFISEYRLSPDQLGK
jgi:hypothetical protein